jgi:Uma2 family endonuclease
MNIEKYEKVLSVEEFLKNDSCELLRYELIDGELAAMAPAGAVHENVVSNLVVLLGNYLKGSGCKVYGSNLAVQIDEYTFLMPDISVICGELKIKDDRCVAPPDLVVEVLSRSTRAYDLGEKRHIYKEFGVKEIWFVDLSRKVISVHDIERELVNDFSSEDELVSKRFSDLKIRVKDCF